MPLQRVIVAIAWIALFAATPGLEAQSARRRNVLLEGWGYPDDGAYEVTLDKETKVSGEASLHVKGVGSNRSYFSMFQGFKADAYHGKRLRFSGQLRTKEVQDKVRPDEQFARAFLWLLIHNTKGQQVVSDEMFDRSLRGTNDWTRCEIVVDVPHDAHKITIGARMILEGEMWVDDLQLEVVGKNVKPTVEPQLIMYERPIQKDLPDQPVNLDLEKEHVFVRPLLPGANATK
jgi:hypothetical protein